MNIESGKKNHQWMKLRRTGWRKVARTCLLTSLVATAFYYSTAAKPHGINVVHRLLTVPRGKLVISPWAGSQEAGFSWEHREQHEACPLKKGVHKHWIGCETWKSAFSAHSASTIERTTQKQWQFLGREMRGFEPLNPSFPSPHGKNLEPNLTQGLKAVFKWLPVYFAH